MPLLHVDCVCVPCDLDKEDLRSLFEWVRFRTAFVQLEKPSDLPGCLELLVEEREKEAPGADITVVASAADESLSAWAQDNSSRLQACLVKVATDLTRCSITTGAAGDGQLGDTCQGMKWEL